MNRLKKLVIAQIILAAGLGTMYALPRTYEIRESAIIMSLPSFVGEWHGKPIEVSELEDKSLADDTDHEKKWYSRFTPGKLGEFDVVHAFIVLSGDDMNNSIHRPERCHTAQGYTIEERGEVEIDIGQGRTLKVMRLLSTRGVKDSTQRISNVTYYWFTGAEAVSNGHYERTWIDMRDRLLTGSNQRWAYVTVAAEFGEGRGESIAVHTETETDVILQDFTRQLFDRIHTPMKLDGLSSD